MTRLETSLIIGIVGVIVLLMSLAIIMAIELSENEKEYCELIINSQRFKMETDPEYTYETNILFFNTWSDKGCNRFYDMEMVLSFWKYRERL